MAQYYVNQHAQTNGDHEVHVQGCTWMPHQNNLVYLGDFTNCALAVQTAKRWYPHADGCAYCSPACHTR
jgi:hypothetical protein